MKMNRNKIMFCLLFATAASCWIVQAGTLEPPSPPGPTMVSLEKIPSSWYQKLGLFRFEVVMDGEAVLDHETNLVWQRNVSESVIVWPLAVSGCRGILIGGRYGWRLPSVEELATLIDVNQSDPALPPLHSFTPEGFTGFGQYWTSTTYTLIPTNAWTVSFEGNGALATDQDKSVNLTPDANRVWCVRGGVGLDTGHN